MPTTLPYFLDPSGHALASVLRQVLNADGRVVRVETKPQSPFAGDPEFDTDLDLLAAPGVWTVENGANADAITSNSTLKGRLYVNLNATNTLYAGATRTGVGVRQVLAGNFSVYQRVEVGDLRDFHQVGWIAQSTSDSRDWVRLVLVASLSSSSFAAACAVDTTVDNVTTTNALTNTPSNERVLGGATYLRLDRSGNNFSAYVCFDGKTWTQIGTTVTRADFSADASVGLTTTTQNTANAETVASDFFRTWPPYATTSPVSARVYDGQVAGAQWGLAAFAPVAGDYDPLQAQIGVGSLKYRLAASDTNPPVPAGFWLTEAGVQALGTLPGRHLALEVQYISPNGYELPRFLGAGGVTLSLPSGGLLYGRGMSGGYAG
jgi:hypothetical protein